MPETIVIVGGGPIGLACALLLHARGIAVRVLEARSLADAQRDARVLACSRGSWSILQPFFAGIALPRADITDVFVSSAGEFGLTHLPSGGEPLGATVFYGELVTALSRAAERAGVGVDREVTVAAIEQHAAHVTIDTIGAAIHAPMAVVAEGHGGATTQPGMANRAPGTDDAWALIASVSVHGPAPGAAFERFTREGPLALLPAPPIAADTGVHPMSLVWCMSGAAATRRLALEDAACIEELQHALASRIGRVTALGARSRFRLVQAVDESIHRHRVVRLGNAAQTLHPVAGQGFNLGLRDCVVLADALARRRRPETADSAWIDTALTEYAARRSLDRRAIASVTAALPGLFASRFAPLALARSAGLTALNLVPPLRDQLAHLLMFGVRN